MRERPAGEPDGVCPCVASGSATPVCHRTCEAVQRHPAHLQHPEARARAGGERRPHAPTF